jgi:ACS family hexuronate transporter-like MFS transporter
MATVVPAAKNSSGGAPDILPRRAAIPNLRWIICGLLFVATTINYLDRQTVAVLNKEILSRHILGWDEQGYGWIQFSFQLAYALMFPVAGRLLDRFGVRAGMFWAVIIWSVAAIGHSVATTVLGFAIARFFLAIGEAGNFPASIKAVAEWFPKRQRALATGVFNSGTNVGVMLSFVSVWIATSYGWQMAFILTGAVGFAWVALWMWLYRAPQEHPRLSAEERVLILSDNEVEPSEASIPWTSFLRYRQAWAFFLGKMLTDPVWWFYLYWLPPYLNKRGVHGLTSAAILVIPYTAASFGSVFGGWLSGSLIKRGWPVGRARLLTMGIYALGMPGAIIAVFTSNFYAALALISLATACHQAWSANVFTLSSDMFPKRAVGSVVGIGSMCGAIGGMFMTLVAGSMLQWLGSYTPLFVLAGVMHPLAWVIIRVLAGKEFVRADVNEGLRGDRSPQLMTAGAILAVLGSALALLVTWQWTAIATGAHNLTTPAAGLVASVLVVILGLVLIYAARGRRAAV